jgi:microcystin-dependent protein
MTQVESAKNEDNSTEKQELLTKIAELEQLVTKVYIHNTRFNLVETQMQAMGVDLQNYVQRYFDDLLVGSVTAFAMPEPPEGWLVCDGRAIDRAKYLRLFNRIGTTHGAGDGVTDFNLPNLNGQFIRGFDKSGKIDPGRKFGELQNDQIQTHTHKDSGHCHSGETSEEGEHDHSDKIDISKLADTVEQSRNLPTVINQQVIELVRAGFEQAIAPARKSGETSLNGKHTHTGSSDSNGSHSHTGSTGSGGRHDHVLSTKFGVMGSDGQASLIYGHSTSASWSASLCNYNGEHTHSFSTSSSGSHLHTIRIQEVDSHSHDVFINSDGGHMHQVSTQTASASLGNPVSYNGSSITHGNETRPKNLALLYCIKY